MSDIVREMIETRRALHRRPEEGWCEFQTTALILERLRALGYEPLCGTRVINPKAVMGRSPKRSRLRSNEPAKRAFPKNFSRGWKATRGPSPFWKRDVRVP